MSNTTNTAKPLRPASAGLRKLLAKLERLAAAPGTPDEGAAAAKKLARLRSRYDFTPPDVSKEGLFAGHYQRSPNAAPFLHLDDASLAYWIKWAIESATGIPCVLRGPDLLASATPGTAQKLSGIGRTIADGFTGLWKRFRDFPTINPEDRDIFLRGLYDGMMNEQKQMGERLPDRPHPRVKARKPKKNALAVASGLYLHPYSVAVELGQQMRFNVPLSNIVERLEEMKPKELAA